MKTVRIILCLPLLALIAPSASAAPRPRALSFTCIAPPDAGCTADADCCAGSACFAGHCRIPEGNPCSSGESCAAGLACIDHLCSAGCGEPGQVVDEPMFCCEGVADANGVCVDTCIAPPDGGCEVDADCCSGSACFAGHCRIPEGNPCNSGESCATGLACIDGLCSAGCGEPGQVVDEPMFCCEGVADDQMVCLDMCIAAPDWGCADDADCCAGAACFAGTCRVPEGNPCNSGESCARGLACIDGLCATGCGVAGQTVDEPMFCCSGLADAHDVCVDGTQEMCVAAGMYGCADLPCCDGAFCFLGVCRALEVE